MIGTIINKGLTLVEFPLFQSNLAKKLIIP